MFDATATLSLMVLDDKHFSGTEGFSQVSYFTVDGSDSFGAYS